MTSSGDSDMGRDLNNALRAIADDALRSGIVELFEKARSNAEAGNFDVIVLAARRLACLYQLLLDNGMPALPSKCLVVSDRFLDIEQPSSWKRVLILDDSVILGTTLLRIYRDVKERADDHVDITCWAVCVDRDQRADYLLQAVNFLPLHERSKKDVEQFSTQVVQALFAGNVPFFSDFPTTRSISYSLEQWQDHLENPGWHVADVTAPLFDGVNREAIAQIPTDATVELFLERVDRTVSPLVENFKVRSYATTDHSAGTVQVRFVPIAMLAPCAPQYLDNALEAIVSTLAPRMTNAEPPLRWQEWSAVAKHRLVQMYASSCAFEMVLRDKGPVQRPRSDVLDPIQVQLYFGAGTKRVLELFDAAVDQFRTGTRQTGARPPREFLSRPSPSWLLEEADVREVLWANSELITYTGLPQAPPKGMQSKIGLIFAHAIASVFGFINKNYELPQRREIRELKGMDEYDKRFPKNNVRRVLGQGLTLRDLQSTLAPDTVGGSSWTRSLVSLGIDIGNDLGIVVPVTQVDESRDLVYRCYRLGETAPLAQTPLPMAAEVGGWDELALTVQSGVPIYNRVVPLSGKPVTSAGEDSALDDLRDEVDRAVPGFVVHRLRGIVRAVSEDAFEADFRDPLMDPPIRTGRFPMSLLYDHERNAIKDGTRVMWTLLDRRADIPERISRVRVRDTAPLDVRQMKLDADAVSFLAKVEDDPAIPTD